MTRAGWDRGAGGAALGIVAGAGRFPFMVADGARRAGCRVLVIGLRGLADPALVRHADEFRWSGIVRLGSWIRILRRAGVQRAILAGSVRKSEMYGRLRLLRYWPDWTSLRLWFTRVHDKRNDTLLRAVADGLAARGITLENSVQYCAEAMAPPGVLTRAHLSDVQRRDIEFGWPIAKLIGQLDVGQAIAVKETEVIAVEAIEGTDRMIARAGELCRQGGWMLIKIAKPNQDLRFDVPTVGPDTIENLRKHGASALIVEAGATLMIERDRLIALADQYRIAIVGWQPDQLTANSFM